MEDPLGIAGVVLDAVDDRVLVYGVGHGLAELIVAEPIQLVRCQIGFVGVRVAARIHVEGQESGAEGRAPLVYGEIPVCLHGFKVGQLLSKDAVGVGLPRQELLKLDIEVWDDDLDDAVEVGEAVAFCALKPVVGVVAQDNLSTGDVALDGEGPGAYDFGGVRVYVPSVGKGPVLDMAIQDVLGVDGCSHGAEEGSEGCGEDALDSVVSKRRYGHGLLFPCAGLLVQESEVEGRTAAGRDVMVVDDLVEGEIDVVGGEGRAVVPLDVLAKVKGPGETILGALPGLGECGFHLIGEP